MSDINPWSKISKKLIYDNPWISLEEHQVLNPAGKPGIYGVIHFKNIAIGIITLDDELQITLVGQYRFALNAYSWEIPEGGGPFNEDPLDAAKRELLEETGLVASSWTQIIQMHLSNSVSDELAIIYLARDLSQHEAQPEETEELIVKKVHLDEAMRMVISGEITDSMSVAAIFRLTLLYKANEL